MKENHRQTIAPISAAGTAVASHARAELSCSQEFMRTVAQAWCPRGSLKNNRRSFDFVCRKDAANSAQDDKSIYYTNFGDRTLAPNVTKRDCNCSRLPHPEERDIATRTLWIFAALAIGAVEALIPRIPLFPWLKPGFS